MDRNLLFCISVFIFSNAESKYLQFTRYPYDVSLKYEKQVIIVAVRFIIEFSIRINNFITVKFTEKMELIQIM